MVFNEIFALVDESKHGKDNAAGAFWHEEIRGQSAADVPSTFVRFIRENRDTKDFKFV